MPVRISALVVAVTKSVQPSCASRQVSTFREGLFRMSSEMTLVSNAIIADFSIEARWFSHGLPWREVEFHTAE